MFTRRAILALLAAIPALSTIGCSPSSTRARPRASAPTLTPDVVIIGGGLAGLAAATRLEERGLVCQLIEAQGSLGGRVSTASADGRIRGERGAQFLNEDMHALAKLLARHRVQTAPAVARGKTVIVGAEGDRRLTEVSSLFDYLDLHAFERVVDEHGGREDLSVAAALARIGGERQRDLVLRSHLVEMLCQPPELLSARGVLAVARGYESERGDELAVTGGLSKVVAGMAQGLVHPPMLESRAEAIAFRGGSVEVRTNRGTLVGRAVVVAVPPPVARRIALPSTVHREVDAALASFLAGDMVKMTLVFGAPFWRSRGLSGALVSIAPEGVDAVDATSPADGGRGRVIVFAGGPMGRALAQKTEVERRAFSCDLLARAYGLPAPPLVDYVEGIWVDHPFSGGGYNAVIRLGGLADAAHILRDIAGRVVFAASEISPRFPGYMEGALVSGRLAADRIG